MSDITPTGDKTCPTCRMMEDIAIKAAEAGQDAPFTATQWFAEEGERRRLEANRRVLQAAFDQGARAMREACAKIVEDWRNNRLAGRGYQGGPLNLEEAVVATKVEHLRGRP